MYCLLGIYLQDLSSGTHHVDILVINVVSNLDIVQESESLDDHYLQLHQF